MRISAQRRRLPSIVMVTVSPIGDLHSSQMLLTMTLSSLLPSPPLPPVDSLSYDDCLEVKRKDYLNCSVLCCVQQLCTNVYVCAQFLNLYVGLTLGFVFLFRPGLAFCVFLVLALGPFFCRVILFC